MILINEIATKIETGCTRNMAPVYTFNDEEYRRFGPKSILKFECNKDIDFSKHNSAKYNNLYLYGLEAIEEDIDDTTKSVKLIIDTICFYKLY